MNPSPTGLTETGLDGPLTEALVGTRRFFTKATVSEDKRSMEAKGGRAGDAFYRDRWSHDKVVRSTHGVNCTGSCSWKVYVKDGIITWEAQQTDYPSPGADRPDYEPRGCPRGAAFSWYTYSPTRVRYPYVRGVLLEMFRTAKAAHGGDPVLAWGSIVEDPEKSSRYKKARGKGGLVRATWEEVSEIVAAAHVYTVKRFGPDRIAGFSPIPAMSPVSYTSGSRFLELIGAPMLSFYDWYADLPNASPQMFGDQTDVPESGDWWDAGYLIMWGSNVPVTRTPDAHWMTEARYRGQKVLAVAPDYAENVKFADEWVTTAPAPTARWRWPWATSSSRSSSSTSRSRSSPTTTSGSPTCRTSSPRSRGRRRYRTGQVRRGRRHRWPEGRLRERRCGSRPCSTPTRRDRDPQRLHRGPLRRRGTRQVEPRPR